MKGLRKLGGLMGLRWQRWLRGAKGLMLLLYIYVYIYIVRWLGHHGNRLYGFMGLRSKKWDWTGWMDTP